MPNTVIALKKSSTPSAVPTGLANGELAINFADGKLFYKNTNGNIVSFSSGTNSFGSINANGTFVVADSLSDILTLIPGTGISIVGDAINDTITFTATGNAVAALDTANIANTIAVAAFNQANTARTHANAAFDKANSIIRVSNTAPTNTSLWFHSGLGKLFVYYTDSNSSQWVDTTRGQFSPISIDVTSDLRTINTNSNILLTDSFILANGTISLTLPLSSTVSGRQYKIKNIGTGVVTILPQGGETIDGKSNTIIGEQYSALTLLSTGSNWLIF